MVLHQDNLGDPTILVNMTINSITHSPGQGQTGVGVRNVGWGWATDNNFVREKATSDGFLGFL
jgi:hypothetical protein